MLFITRAYNNIVFNPDSNTILKTSVEKRLNDEIDYYNTLSNELKIHFPRLKSFDTLNAPYKMELEFYTYKNVARYYLSEKHTNQEFWNKFFNSLFSIISAFKKDKKNYTKEQIKLFCKNMFIDKTINEYNNLKNNFSYFSELCSRKEIYLNNIKYNNFDDIWQKIENKIFLMIEKQENFNVIHGDMCFSNILLGYDEDIENITIKLVDPRGSFGEKGIYGSSLYDYAKILHSIDGNYESFIYDKFILLEENKKYNLKILNNKINEEICVNEFKKNLSNQEFLDSKLIEGLIFIGMCARHYDSLERQKAMYLTGIRILNEVLYEDMR